MGFFDEVSLDEVLEKLEESSDEEFLRKAQKAGLIEERPKTPPEGQQIQYPGRLDSWEIVINDSDRTYRPDRNRRRARAA